MENDKEGGGGGGGGGGGCISNYDRFCHISATIYAIVEKDKVGEGGGGGLREL